MYKRTVASCIHTVQKRRAAQVVTVFVSSLVETFSSSSRVRGVSCSFCGRVVDRPAAHHCQTSANTFVIVLSFYCETHVDELMGFMFVYVDADDGTAINFVLSFQ